MSLLARMEREKKVQGQAEGSERAERPGKPSSGSPTKVSDPNQRLKSQVHEKLVSEIDPGLAKQIDSGELSDEVKAKLGAVIHSVIEAEAPQLTRADRQTLVAEISDEVLGFGPINGLLNDPSVSEVMVNGPKQVYIERKGKLELTDVVFRDNDHVMHVIEKIVAPIGRRIDESSPMVDARLPDGSRVNAIIPPLSLVGPCITIRKFSREPFQVQDLIRFGTLTEQMAWFLEACVKSRLNIVVSGGTGSGKTTTLNVLSSFIPADERIVTVEDAAELQLRQEHVVSLESRPPNIEGKGAISIRDLVRNCLRMRPDRIVVGEVRGGEALDMLQAMNTGHDGSLTTGHANSPRDMLARLETMVLMAGMDLPVKAIREQISSAVDVIVQQTRLRDGSRRITHITEVQGMEGEIVTLQDIFIFEQRGVDENGKIVGRLRPTGIRPKFAEKFIQSGIQIPPDLFAAEWD